MQSIDNNRVHVNQFDMLSATSGWVLLGQHLFWTHDAGQTWKETGPFIPTDAVVMDVEFINSEMGWMLFSTIDPNGYLFQLAHTIDSGRSWSTRSLSLFESGEVASYAEKAEMGWFDRMTGWVSVKQTSGSNFSVGTLFTTSDGGSSWSRFTLPVADHVYFSEPQIGWAVGGPTSDQVSNTLDGGITWQSTTPAIQANSLATAYTPFHSGGNGLLVMTHLGPENSLNIYTLEDSFDKWLLASQFKMDIQPGIIGLSILDSHNFVATIPGTSIIVRMKNGELETLENKDGLSASIVALDMVSLDIGWAKSIISNCATFSLPTGQNSNISCSSSTRLLHTTDGGLSWLNLDLPLVQSDIIPLSDSNLYPITTMNIIQNLGNTNVFIGQGFDKCEIPTLSQLQTWWDSSPYKTVNLYIGGSSRACENNTLTSSYLSQLYQQGWKFIPTWVGPQAPCTGYSTRMSSDVTTAYNQGVNEANLAIERLAALGLTYPDKTGSVVYYDIEYYGTNTACRQAVNAFMNGWVSQIHARGNIAGVYGSTLCNTGLSDFLNIANVPDVIWPARWYHNPDEGYYDPGATVWNLGSCVSNTVWANHQRIRQYEGDHDETWGDLTMGIDSNVLDGIVANAYVAPLVQSITRIHSNPSDAVSVGFTVKISEAVKGVDSSDFYLTTSKIVGASISSVSGSGDRYTVIVNTGLGNGTIRLDVIDNDSIKNASNNLLGGSGIENGNFNSGETYTILKSATFADVPNSHWAWTWIERLYSAGITGGCGGSNYCPDHSVTRAQMAVFLEKGIHDSSFTPPDILSTFGDTVEHWAEDWIESLKDDGITSGCGAGNYCPEDPVTRAQMAVFLLKSKYGSAYTPPSVGASTGFDDVPVTHWAAAWIKQLAAEGITGGCGAGIYCPDNPVTRAQMAVFLVKTFGLP